MADTTSSPTDPVILAANQAAAQANAQKAVFDAQKAAYDAQAAAIGAKLAADKAAVGAVPDSGFTGKVTPGADAGKAEATLLAARSANLAAAKIAQALGGTVKGKTVRIYASAERPTVEHWAAFNLRVRLLAETVIPKARDLDKTAIDQLGNIRLAPTPHGRTQLLPVAAIGLGIDAVRKLGALFQSDYTVASIALNPDDALLATSVAGTLTSPAMSDNAPGGVYLASRSTTLGADADLYALLSPLAAEAAQAPGRVAFLQERAKTVRADPKAKEARYIDATAACDQAAAAWQLVSTNYDALITSATTPDSAGAVPLARIAAEKTLATALAHGDMVLFTQMNASVGGYYIKNNLWTFFGGMPFYVTGGAVVSYALVAGPDGRTVAAGVIPYHGGWVQAPKIEAVVNGGK